jgi:hypothetical protein
VWKVFLKVEVQTGEQMFLIVAFVKLVRRTLHQIPTPGVLKAKINRCPGSGNKKLVFLEIGFQAFLTHLAG